ncbi:MAG: hypothetical protein ABSD42_07280 [Candidatus Bathyarchaeia archaeon]|jgi:hypothetical protein
MTYTGGLVFEKNSNSPNYIRDRWLPFLENGIPVWSIEAEDSMRKPYKKLDLSSSLIAGSRHGS